MARKKRSRKSSGKTDRKERSDESTPPLPRGRRVLPVRSRAAFAALRRASRAPGAPAALRGWSMVLGEAMSTLHAPAESKVLFEALRAGLRDRLGFPVTQPGMFAAVVEFAAARQAEFFGEVAASLATESADPSAS